MICIQYLFNKEKYSKFKRFFCGKSKGRQKGTAFIRLAEWSYIIGKNLRKNLPHQPNSGSPSESYLRLTQMNLNTYPKKNK